MILLSVVPIKVKALDMSVLLERALPPNVDPAELVNRNILVNAEKELNYRHPAKMQMISKNELTNALRIVGLKPFTLESVERHKEAEKTKHQEHPIMGFLKNHVDVVGEFSIIAILVCIFASIVLAFLLDGKILKLWEGITVILLVLSIGLLISEAYLWPKVKIDVHWRRSQLNGYDAPIPEFALATALELHQRLPGIQFEIDELLVNRVRCDPFLVATYKGVEYYLEVWSEPGYTQERMAVTLNVRNKLFVKRATSFGLRANPHSFTAISSSLCFRRRLMTTSNVAICLVKVNLMRLPERAVQGSWWFHSRSGQLRPDGKPWIQ